MALFTLLMVLLNFLDVALNLRVLTTALCVLVDKGGKLFYLAHMIHECGGNEDSAGAAASIYWGVGYLIGGINIK